MTSPRPRDQGEQIPQESHPNTQAELGGADAVQKTTYVVGESADPDRQHRPGTVTPRVSAGGRSPLMWIVVAVIVLLALWYAAGMFR